MAAEKKKTDKKVEKKPVKKVAASAKKPVKKSTKNVAAVGDLTINVPKGGQVIKFFNLTPALPTPMGPGDWKFTEVGSTVDISTLTVRFELNPSAIEREFERAILAINIQQNPATNGTWRFALGGVATDAADGDPNNDIALEIVDNGFTMLVYVHVLENSDEIIPFGFVASFTNTVTGAVFIYESQDPQIQPRRP